MYRNNSGVNRPFKSPVPNKPIPSGPSISSESQTESPTLPTVSTPTSASTHQEINSTPTTKSTLTPSSSFSGVKRPWSSAFGNATGAGFRKPLFRSPVEPVDIESLKKREKELDEEINSLRPVDGRPVQECLKMIDLVFVVDNPLEWHTENLKMNGSHYSGLKYFGPKLITAIQEKMASGVYYNPYVRIDDQLLKYGVISTKALEKDLTQWSQIYIAGRLHKPVLDLKGPVTSNLVRSIKSNRESALRAVLLQEGRYISKYSLYHGITELSYLGDTRMKVAENPEKTRNIVTPLIEEFEYVYSPLIDELHPMVEVNDDGLLVQDTTPQVRFKHLMALPNPVQMSLSRQLFRDPRLFDIEEVMAELSYAPTLRTYIRNSVAEVVWSSSILQTIQGLLSAGVVRSVRYAYEKLQKRQESKKQKKAIKKSGNPFLYSGHRDPMSQDDNSISKDEEIEYNYRKALKRQK